MCLDGMFTCVFDPKLVACLTNLSTPQGDVETVKELLGQGADPNLKDDAGWTPLVSEASSPSVFLSRQQNTTNHLQYMLL